MATATASLAIGGMHCSSCALLIDDVLEDLPGVTSARTDARREMATVRYDAASVGLDDMVAAVVEAGYTAEPVEV